ncbi:MAG TPA: hypothetical protein VK543_12130 [Puia sp.]|nr:hypothetical protein [Puia sp.]
MKKIIAYLHAVVLLLLVLVPVSCMKDRVNYTYTIETPVLQTLSQVRAGIKTGPIKPIENAGKIYSFGKYIFLNELERGIHIIDNSNPAHPENIGFINIPGNENMAVKGSMLYADSYSDLVALDISNPLHVAPTQFLSNIFSNRSFYYSNSTNPDSILIVVDWIAKDTTVDYNTYQRYMSCSGFAGCWYPAAYMSSVAAPAASGSKGIGGSTARFTIVGDYLYTLSSPDLSSFDISTGNPRAAGKVSVDWSAETIYPFKDKLFVGASNGMSMYDILSDPANPKTTGKFAHARSCDPVVADDNYAYVTLSSGTQCQGFENELDIVNIKDIYNATLTKTYALNHPKGLAKDGNILFICDESEGLKIYDASDVNNLHLLKHFKDASTIDLVVNNGLAVVLTKNGLYEYDYSDINNIHLLGMLLTLKV